jgi:hypothetical protein
MNRMNENVTMLKYLLITAEVEYSIDKYDIPFKVVG